MVSASPFHQRRVRGAVPHTYGTSFRRYPSSRVVWRAWNIEISSFGGQSPPTSLVHSLMVLQRSHNDGLRHRETEARKACCTVLYEPSFLLYSQNNLMIVRTQVKRSRCGPSATYRSRRIVVSYTSRSILVFPLAPRTCEPGSTMITETRSIPRRLRSRLRAHGRAALGLRPTSLFNVQSVLGPRPKAGSETQSRRRLLRTPL